MKRFPGIIVGIIIITALLSAACLPAGALTWLRGDADGDGEVTSLDVTVIQRVIAEIMPDPDGSIAKRGDVTRDSLTAMDASWIQWYLARLDNRYHIGEEASDDGFPTEDDQLPILEP